MAVTGPLGGGHSKGLFRRPSLRTIRFSDSRRAKSLFLRIPGVLDVTVIVKRYFHIALPVLEHDVILIDTACGFTPNLGRWRRFYARRLRRCAGAFLCGLGASDRRPVLECSRLPLQPRGRDVPRGDRRTPRRQQSLASKKRIGQFAPSSEVCCSDISGWSKWPINFLYRPSTPRASND
jgi:hypothetical protein